MKAEEACDKFVKAAIREQDAVAQLRWLCTRTMRIFEDGTLEKIYERYAAQIGKEELTADGRKQAFLDYLLKGA